MPSLMTFLVKPSTTSVFLASWRERPHRRKSEQKTVGKTHGLFLSPFPVPFLAFCLTFPLRFAILCEEGEKGRGLPLVAPVAEPRERSAALSDSQPKDDKDSKAAQYARYDPRAALYEHINIHPARHWQLAFADAL